MRGNGCASASTRIAALTLLAALLAAFDVASPLTEARPRAPIPVQVNGGTGAALSWRTIGDGQAHLNERTLPGVASRWTLLPGLPEVTGLRLEGHPEHSIEFLLTQRPPSFVLAVITGDERQPPTSPLLPERFLDDGMQTPPFRTAIARTYIAQVPAMPAWWCAYDVAVLASEALTRLDGAQADALERWIRAGGNALLLPDDNASTAAQALCARLAQTPALTDLRIAHRAGVGMAVICAPSAFPAVAGPESRHLAAALWRVRSSLRERLAAQQKLELDEIGELVEQAQAFVSRPYSTGSGYFLPHLKPEQEFDPRFFNTLAANVTPPPWWLILIPLVLIILWFVPGEWWLLRRGTRSRWMLLSLPVASVATTLLTFTLGQAWLGGQAHDRELVVRDVDADGHVLRSLRYGMLLRPTAEQVRIPLGAGLGWGGDWHGLPGRNLDLVVAVAPWKPTPWRSFTFGGDAGEIGAAPWRDLPTQATKGEFSAWLVRALNGRPGAGAVNSTPEMHFANTDWARLAFQRFPGLDGTYLNGWTAVATGIAPHGGPGFDELPVRDRDDHHEVMQLIAWRDGERLIIERRLCLGDASR